MIFCLDGESVLISFGSLDAGAGKPDSLLLISTVTNTLLVVQLLGIQFRGSVHRMFTVCLRIVDENKPEFGLL